MSAFRTLASTYLRRCALWWLPMLGVLIVFPCLIVWLVWCEAGTPGLWSSEADQLLASLQPPTFYVNFQYRRCPAAGRRGEFVAVDSCGLCKVPLRRGEFRSAAEVSSRLYVFAHNNLRIILT
jgi:hypothetical protein